MIDICESSGFLQALLILKTIFRIICYIVPLILIFMLSLDVYKLVSNPDDTKKVIPLVTKRLIAALIILFIPSIINLTLRVVGRGTSVQTCWNNASSEYIEAVKAREEANRQATKHNYNNNASDGESDATIIEDNDSSHSHSSEKF